MSLERIETILYGAPQGGGLLPRLSRAEKETFGRELPGSLTERQMAMLNFLEKGSVTQPSLLFKLSVAEWGVAHSVHPEWSLTRRVETIETMIDGSVQQGALAARTEKLMTKLLPEGVTLVNIEVPAATLVKAALTSTLTVRNTKVNDKIVLKLVNEVAINNVLIAPVGSRVFAHITKVKPPRSFGRGSVIEMEFDELETIAPADLAVTIGESAKKAMETDTATVGAAGASVAGAVLLGPVGLVSGAFIRGTNNQLKAGMQFYVETVEAATVQGYKVPQQLTPLVTSDTVSGDAQEPQGAAPKSANN